MKVYQDLLSSILRYGETVGSRQGGKTISHPIPPSFVHDMRDGFPLLTTKKMFIRGIVDELNMFLSGHSDIRYLWQRGVHIWDGDWIRWSGLDADKAKQFIESLPDWKSFPMNRHEIINGLPKTDHVVDGIPRASFPSKVNECALSIFGRGLSSDEYSLGNIYGVQWRGLGVKDHLKNSIEMLKTNPTSRQNVVSAWVGDQIDKMALPPCHTLFQLRRRGENNEFLDLTMFQRSCDAFLGLPFNIASYAILMHYICAMVGDCTPRFLKIDFGDLHIYEEHTVAVNQLLSRSAKALPTFDYDDIYYGDYVVGSESLGGGVGFKILNYEPHETISAKLIV